MANIIIENLKKEESKKMIKILTLLFVAYVISTTVYDQNKNNEIQGFYTSSNTDDYKKLDYELLNTIIYAQVDINMDGSLIQSYNYNPSPLISYAHDRKVKVVLMFQGKDEISKDILLENHTIRALAINNLIDEVNKYNFDGIDIDLEGLNIKNSINGQPNKQLITDFITNLSDKFRTINVNYRISMDISSNYMDASQIFDLTVLQNKVDYVMIMSYDQNGPWSLIAGPIAPIKLDNGNGIHESVKHYKGLIDKNKLLLGIPWYGYMFETESDSRLSSINGSINYISYKNYINTIKNYNRKWDHIWKTPWYAFQDNNEQWHQFHYEDVRSLGRKYNLAKSEGLGGIGIWNVNFGIDNNELWQLIRHKFR